VGIFKYLRFDGQESEHYDLLDRSIHFQILQNIDDPIERGLCMQSFEVEVIRHDG